MQEFQQTAVAAVQWPACSAGQKVEERQAICSAEQEEQEEQEEQ